MVRLGDVRHRLAAADNVRIGPSLAQQVLYQRRRRGFLIAFLVRQGPVAAVVGDVEEVPFKPVFIAVVSADFDDLFHIAVLGVAHLEIVVVRAVHLKAHVEHERGRVADDVAVVAMLDEGRVAEEFNLVHGERETRDQRAGIDEQVVACRGRLAPGPEQRLQPVHQRLGLGEHQDVASLEQAMAGFLSQEHELFGLLLPGSFLQQHRRRHPELPDLDAPVALVSRGMLQLEELGAAADVVGVGMGERNDVEVVAIDRSKVGLESFVEINLRRCLVLRLVAVAEVEKDAPPEGEHDLGGIAVADGVEDDLMFAAHGALPGPSRRIAE